MAGLFNDEVTVLQINLHRCKLAQDLMTQYAMEKEENIVIISEPYCIQDNWEKGIVAIAIDDIMVFSCYISPNILMDEYREILTVLEIEVTKVGTNRSIIAGDLNAKAVTCGDRDTRIREGMRYWKCQPGTTSYPLEVEHVFRHKGKDNHPDRGAAHQTKTRVDMVKFINKYPEMTWATDTTRINTIMDIDNYISRTKQLVKEASSKTHTSCFQKKAVWWWNSNTAKVRKEVIRTRRRYQRVKTKQTMTNMVDKLKNDYYDKKKKLKAEINKAKSETWLTFIGSIDQDPWGKPYKWIINKARGKSMIIRPSAGQVEEAVDKLFVTKPHSRRGVDEEYTPTNGVDEMDEEFNEDEVARAIKKVKKKALGLDLIPCEVVWELGKGDIGTITQVINSCYIQGYFPKERLNKYVKCQENQYGFRKGRSTLHAMEKILRLWDDARKRRHHCALVTLDVKNAFNTIKWELILDALKKNDIPTKLYNIIRRRCEYNEEYFISAPNAKEELGQSGEGIPHSIT
ncbi:uncharacterized protein LOC144467607 [Augochlora pura]